MVSLLWPLKPNGLILTIGASVLYLISFVNMDGLIKMFFQVVRTTHYKMNSPLWPFKPNGLIMESVEIHLSCIILKQVALACGSIVDVKRTYHQSGA